MPENQAPSQASTFGVSDKSAGHRDAGEDKGGGAVLIYSTFPTLDTARVLARQLIKARLAACVNVIPGMVAIYEFEGRLHEDGEAVCIIKTRRSLRDACVSAVCDGHPYSNPAAVSLDISGGAPAYLAWLMESTRSPQSGSE